MRQTFFGADLALFIRTCRLTNRITAKRERQPWISAMKEKIILCGHMLISRNPMVMTGYLSLRHLRFIGNLQRSRRYFCAYGRTLKCRVKLAAAFPVPGPAMPLSAPKNEQGGNAMIALVTLLPVGDA